MKLSNKMVLVALLPLIFVSKSHTNPWWKPTLKKAAAISAVATLGYLGYKTYQTYGVEGIKSAAGTGWNGCKNWLYGKAHGTCEQKFQTHKEQLEGQLKQNTETISRLTTQLSDAQGENIKIREENENRSRQNSVQFKAQADTISMLQSNLAKANKENEELKKQIGQLSQQAEAQQDQPRMQLALVQEENNNTLSEPSSLNNSVIELNQEEKELIQTKIELKELENALENGLITLNEIDALMNMNPDFCTAREAMRTALQTVVKFNNDYSPKNAPAFLQQMKEQKKAIGQQLQLLREEVKKAVNNSKTYAQQAVTKHQYGSLESSQLPEVSSFDSILLNFLNS